MRIMLTVLAGLLTAAVALAEEDPRAGIAEMLPGIKAEDVRESPLPGIYEVK